MTTQMIESDAVATAYAAREAAQRELRALERQAERLPEEYHRAVQNADATAMTNIRQLQQQIGERLAVARIVAARRLVEVREAELRVVVEDPAYAQAKREIVDAEAAAVALRAALEQADARIRGISLQIASWPQLRMHRQDALEQARRQLNALLAKQQL